MYLATLPLNDKTYEKWKKELQQGIMENSDNISLNKNEIEAAKKNAENILNNFNPLDRKRVKR